MSNTAPTAGDPTRAAEIAALLTRLAVIMSGPSPSTDELPVSRAMPTRVLLTVEEAAEQLGIGRTLLYKLIARGEIESIRIGRLRRVPTTAIQEHYSKPHVIEKKNNPRAASYASR